MNLSLSNAQDRGLKLRHYGFQAGQLRVSEEDYLLQTCDLDADHNDLGG